MADDISDLIESLEKSLEPVTHFAWVGRIASVWALFELALDDRCIRLSRMDALYGFCLTSQVIGSARKIDAFIAISKLRGASMMNGEFDKFAKSTAALAEKRNRIIHDPWCENDDGSVTKTEVSARRLFKFEILESDIDQLQRLFSDILNHIQWLDKIFTEVDAMPEP